MDEKTTLAKRLAAYSAAAGIALAAAPDASGQIIFHDIDPDIHFDTGGGVAHVLPRRTGLRPGWCR